MYFDYLSKNVFLSSNEDENTIQIQGQNYYLEELYPGAASGKGWNSCVFTATPVFDNGQPYVVKFCRYPIQPRNRNFTKRVKRFGHEIAALKKAKEEGMINHVLDVICPGKLTLTAKRFRDSNTVELLYYVMEKADIDLARHLEEEELNFNDRLELATKVAEALQAMHGIGLRHRDLKPDNIFLVGDLVKLGDLGIAEDRERDYSLDGFKEKIGPNGFLSPEAINKAYGDSKRMPSVSQTEICEKSDTYQLGLVLFYVLQGEIPVGCIEQDDFEPDWESRPNLISNLVEVLQFRKCRRPELSDLINSIATPV
jgi:serine/threonine protein kinase